MQTELCWPIHTITCVNMTPLLCQKGLKQDLTQPNPMISSIQTLASLGLKGHFTLYSKVFSYSAPFGSAQGHTLPIAPAMRHFTERTNSSSTERSSDMNTMHSLSSLPAKRHKMYSVGVSCMCNQGGEGVLGHVRRTRACGLPDGARSGELHTGVLTCAVRANDRHTHSEVHVHNRGFGSGKADFIVTLHSSKYGSANMVRVLPFAPLEAFSLLSWKSMMCVRRLSKKAVACEMQIMLPVKDSSQSSSHLKLSCDQRAHQA